MEDRLKGLKKAMETQKFKGMKFSDKSKAFVRKQMQQDRVMQEMLHLLIEEKSGVILSQLLHAKGEFAVDKNEGMIYSLLHEAERGGLIISRWLESGEKVYQLTKLGREQIVEVEQKKTLFDLKQLWQEVRGV